MRMLAAGEVDAVVSAGNTSAIVAAAKHFVGLLPGLRRPVLAVPFPIPAEHGRPVLLDAGAHDESGALHLPQSAALAYIYLNVREGIERPSIGLPNIGHEPVKSARAVQRAFASLSNVPA